MNFLECAAYLITVSIIGFFAGRIMPKQWLKPDKGLFRCYPFEMGGRIYEKLKIHKWHKRVPDISRLLPFIMPAKNLKGNFQDRLPEMIRETCVAELIHLLVSLSGLLCLWLWPGVGGIIVTAIFIIPLNFPFILIQRYNRPRLIRLQQRLEERKREKVGVL